MSEPRNPVTAGTFYNSVTGEERGLVNRAYGRPLGLAWKGDPETFVEMLVFLDMHRNREPDAQRRASALTVGELQSWFADEDPAGSDEVGEA